MKRHLAADQLQERAGSDPATAPRRSSRASSRSRSDDLRSGKDKGHKYNQLPHLHREKVTLAAERVKDEQIARSKAEEKLRKELTKVYYEEYSDIDNDVLYSDYYYDYDY